MPMNPVGALGASGQPDFVLGDRDGTSCDLDFTYALRDFLKGLGYRVALNNPYKGVELVRLHGRPKDGYNSLQIEINKALYWNEHRSKRNKNYNELKSDIDKLIEFCASYAAGSLTAIAAD
jgi:N-formylglutamate amidohydrolase